jgi:hypothetical protein
MILLSSFVNYWAVLSAGFMQSTMRSALPLNHFAAGKPSITE